MSRTLIIGFILLFISYSARCESKDPHQVIDRFEKEIQGINAETKDSLKYALLSAYIQDFRDVGKEIAYDSLQTRINRLLAQKNTTSEEKPKADVVIETEKSSELSKLNELEEENRKLRQELETLKKRSENTQKPDSIEEKLSHSSYLMISEEIRKTTAIADSLTTQTQNTEERISPPIYFDSISHADFQNYIQVSELQFKRSSDTTKLMVAPFLEKADIYSFQNKQRRRTVNALAISNPELIEFYNLSAYDSKSGDIKRSGKNALGVDVDDYRIDPTFEKLSDFLKPKKESLWTSAGKLSIQFSQYYVTKNWYKGGEPNATLLSILEYSYDYNNNDKLIWDNDLDVKIGFFNSGNDTLRAFRVNNDVFKITSGLGYQTFYKKWYYSLNGEFNTSMFTSYAGTNSTEVVTAFLSPTRIFMSLGLDYRYNKNTSVSIAPMAYKLIFLTSNRIDPLTVGISEGKSSNSFGYMLRAKLNWKFTREISVKSNFNLFSTYNCKNVEFNWETVGNFVINRYLSTRLSLNMRYDNTPKKTSKNEKIKLQIQEQLSFGFYYKF